MSEGGSEMKKIISIVSSTALIIAGALSLSVPVSADHHIEDIYGASNNNIHTSIYYEKTTKEIYMSGYDYWHAGSSSGQKYWYYKINDKNKYEQQMRIAESANDTSGYKYYKDLKECTQQEFEEALYQYEKNDKLTKVDIDKGFSKVNPTDYKMTDIDIPDYSYIRNITLDVQENTSATLEPKIMLYGTDIDLKVTWKSSDSRIAEVDSEGKVTAKAEGSCTVTSEIEGIGAVETYNITVEPYMTETEKKVKTLSEQYSSGQISEKEMYDKIYQIEEYKNDTQGHVITDLGGEDGYELITRSSNENVIYIYKVVDGKIKTKSFTAAQTDDFNKDTIEAKSTIVYSVGSDDICNARIYTIVRDHNALKLRYKIFEYRGISVDAEKIKEYTVNFKINPVSNKEEIELDAETSENIMSYAGYEEFFNDDENMILTENDYWNSDQVYRAFNAFRIRNSRILEEDGGSFYSGYSDCYTCVMFTDNTQAHINGYLQRLATAELYSHHDVKGKDALEMAFLNKKPNYNGLAESAELNNTELSNKNSIENIYVPAR